MTGPSLSAASLVVVSPFVGSFLGVVIRRLPEGRPIAGGRSRCEHCGAVLAVRDLVPLASWLAARGRCRMCRARLGWFYPGIELAAIGVALLSLAANRGAASWLDWGLGCWLLALAAIDLRRGVLPDVLTLPLVIAGIGEAWLCDPAALCARALGAAIGFLGLWAVAWIYRRLRGRDGLGLGDAKLFAAAGAWVGAGALPSVLLGASTAALAVAGALHLAGRKFQRGSEMPFGPFLAVALWAVWLWGSPIPS